MKKVTAFTVVTEEERAGVLEKLFSNSNTQVPTSVICHGDVMKTKSDAVREHVTGTYKSGK
ncbi:hypothetical protein COF68_06300 [Bacillus toyonensis]|uniref:hypothetical protein n=1 Tax=Bacillus toyonensis TaxID=155322 RepID=UPI000C022F0A|nr:hypothetical protein [Bacillus toyonensis]PHE64445.1 hypothetical protein COF68_06300 [Bacillus toyonensis]